MMALPGLLTEPEPKSPLFFPRPGDACESLDSLFNLAQFCLLGAATSPEQVRESPRSGPRHQTPLPPLPHFLWPGSTEVQKYQTQLVPTCPDSHGPAGWRWEDAGVSQKGVGWGGGQAWDTERKRGWQRKLGEGELRATCPSVEEEPEFSLLCSSALGERPLLRKPEPAGAQLWLFPEEGLHPALLLCPGPPQGCGVCYHGTFLVRLLWALTRPAIAPPLGMGFLRPMGEVGTRQPPKALPAEHLRVLAFGSPSMLGLSPGRLRIWSDTVLMLGQGRPRRAKGPGIPCKLHAHFTCCQGTEWGERVFGCGQRFGCLAEWREGRLHEP